MLIASEFDLNMACRTCLSNGEMLSLYEKRTTEASLAEMLMSCTSVNYYENDGLAAQICLDCVTEINRSYKFAIKCKESDDKLQKYLQNNLTPDLAVQKIKVDTENAGHNLKENNHIINAYAHSSHINESYNNTLSTVHIQNDPIPIVENKIDLKLPDPLNINQIQNISSGNMGPQFSEINHEMLTSLEVQNQDLKRLKNKINCDHQTEQSLPIINNILPIIDILDGVKVENDSEIINSNVDPLDISISSEFEYKQRNESLNAESSKSSSREIKSEIPDGTENEADSLQSNETPESKLINNIFKDLDKSQSITSLADQLSTSSSAIPRECITSAIGNEIENNSNSSLKSRKIQKSLITNTAKVIITRCDSQSFQKKSPISEATSSFYKFRKRTRQQPINEEYNEDSLSDSSQNSDCESVHSNYEDSESNSTNSEVCHTETSSNLELDNETDQTSEPQTNEDRIELSNNKDLISKQFNNNKKLTKHSKTEKEQPCPVCGKLLLRKFLYKHMNVHSLSFKCDICQKSFGRKRNLQAHMSLHNKKTVYACTICDKFFNAEVYLWEHCQMHHNVAVLSNSMPDHVQNLENKPLIFEAINNSNSKLHEQSSCRQPDISDSNKDSHNPSLQANDCKTVQSNYKKYESEPSNNKDCQTETSNDLKSNHLDNLTEHSSTKAQTNVSKNVVFNNEDHLGEQFNNTENDSECSNSMLVQRKKNVHTSTICDKLFSSRVNLKKQIKTHSIPRNYLCEMCNYPFREAAALETHMKVHTGEKPLSCSFCGKCFSEVSSLKIHMQSHDDDRPYSCSKCDRKFARETYLQSHRKVHTDVKAHVCEVCNRPFRKAANLRNHMFIHTGKKPHSCSICKKTFVSTCVLKRHKRTHAKERPFSCVVCNRSFSSKYQRTSHMFVHSGQGCICPICGKTLLNNASLQVHLQTHTQEKHTCTICDNSYNTRGGMRRHMRNIHSETEPFTCAICNKSFKCKESLQQHIRRHSNDKPFSCLVCDKSFRNKGCLKQHMPSHSEERSYSCTVCNKGFKKKAHLTIHMLTHKEERLFECTLCDLKFRLNHHLKAHVVRKHPS